MKSKQFESAAAAAGIAAEYINAKGKSEAISQERREKLLAAMHRPKKAADAPLPPSIVIVKKRRGQAPTVGGSGDYIWSLQTEQGKTYSGEIKAGDVFSPPPRLPEGYHQLLLSKGKKQWSSRLIVAPKRCYEPDALKQGEKLWGACVQLYTLRSERNWGIGDFGDLQLMLLELAQRGGAFIGLNPIHALYPAMPENASPYSPSSRRWLNIIYIDVAAIPDFQQSAQAQRWWQSKKTQKALAAARDTPWVDYSRVTELKLSALRLAWPQFTQREDDDPLRLAFEQFVHDGGDALFYQAAYDVLNEKLAKEEKGGWGWPAWPDAWQQADGEAVKTFCQQQSDDILFWQWLQWLANRQFDACWQLSQQHAMPIGLYRDLAVGVAEGGSETWCDRELYCLQASVGAPPDPLGPQGQNWGLPPLDPHVMAARGYQPFIDLLRANMASCGALRIDHVMSLLRLWWIPRGEKASEGAYVHYPVDDLLAILALESQRMQCMVIGEDLGTVPKEIVSKLRDSGVYSWKVLYFEQEDATTWRAPSDLPRQAMASATTHDLPTLRGFWDEGDLKLGEKLNLYPDKMVLKELFEDRARQKQALLDALHRYGCVPKSYAKNAEKRDMDATLNRGMQRFVADSSCALMGIQPEDWLDMAEPVNVPGTSDEYPNWRRKLSVTLEEMFADASITRLTGDLNRRRRAS